MNKNYTHIINKLGEDTSHYKNSIVPPIYFNSNYEFETVADLRYAIQNETESLIYTRGNNPTTRILCEKIAALENGEKCLAFASGSGAIAAAVIPFLQKGDHVICIENCYGWTKYLFNDLLKKYGVEISFINGKEIESFKQAIQKNTALIYLESPNSHIMELQDIKAVSELAKQHSIKTIIDNTYATPFYQQPLDMGVDVVVYSGSKYYGGHSDLIAGFVVSNEEDYHKIFKNSFMCLGACMSPFNAWLILRSLRTMRARMEAHSKSALQIANFLLKHPKVKCVYHPHLKSHPQYDLAKRQMKQCGGLFSFTLKTNDQNKIESLCENLNHFKLAVSWGGHDSLIMPSLSLHDKFDISESSIPKNLIRLFIGLEDSNTLIQDLKRQLDKL